MPAPHPLRDTAPFLLEALKRRFRSPQHVLRHLGLDEALLDELDDPTKGTPPMSQTNPRHAIDAGYDALCRSAARREVIDTVTQMAFDNADEGDDADTALTKLIPVLKAKLDPDEFDRIMSVIFADEDDDGGEEDEPADLEDESDDTEELAAEGVGRDNENQPDDNSSVRTAPLLSGPSARGTPKADNFALRQSPKQLGEELPSKDGFSKRHPGARRIGMDSFAITEIGGGLRRDAERARMTSSAESSDFFRRFPDAARLR
jgi:hypothetical protein